MPDTQIFISKYYSLLKEIRVFEETSDSRAGTWKVQDKPEHFMPESKSKELLKRNQKLKNKTKQEDMSKGHKKPTQRNFHWTVRDNLRIKLNKDSNTL